MTRAAVTGAGGFVGTNLVQRLLADGLDVAAIVRPGSDLWRLDGIDACIRETDISDASAVAETFADLRPVWIFHLAAHGAYSWQQDDDAIIATNVLGTANVVRAALDTGCEALVFGGTSSEYGPLDYAPAEDEPVNPTTTYGLTKAFGTLYCSLVAREQSAPISVLRLYSAYGPFEDPRRLVPRLVSEALDGGLPQLASPEAAHDFVYVDDVCDAFVRAAECAASPAGQVYNIGSGTQTTLRELVHFVTDRFEVGVEPRWSSMGDRPWDTAYWCADAAKAGRELDWRATTSLADGIDRFASWLSSDPERRRRYAGSAA